MAEKLTAGQKAAKTRTRRLAAAKAVVTKKRMSALAKARAAEAASKEALRTYCEEHGWKVAFFDGAHWLSTDRYHRRGCISPRPKECGCTRDPFGPVEGR